MKMRNDKVITLSQLQTIILNKKFYHEVMPLA